jgi:type IV secretory pathway VirB2 component (pilin)
MGKKNNYRFIVASCLVFLFFNFLPLLILAQETAPAGLVPCGTGPNGSPDDCKWEHLLQLFNNVINFLLFSLLMPLAVIAIVYAGIQILISQDKPAQLKKAYGTLKNVGIGMFMALGAYAIIKTIVTMLDPRTGSALEQALKFFET